VLNKQKIRQSFSKAAHSYDQMARLQKQVARDLLDWSGLPQTGQTVLELGCGTGFLTEYLAAELLGGQLVALDIALPMLHKTRARPGLSRCSGICADAENLPFSEAVFDAIYSSLALQWCQSLTETFKGFSHSLKPGGKLVFSTFGPQSLQELKMAWAAVDDNRHVNSFMSVDSIRQALQSAGFKQVKSRQHLYEMAYPDVWALMRELKAIGAHHVDREPGQLMVTPQQMGRMVNAYPKQKTGGIIASNDIIFVQAWL
jgi:malonyl-CoA O-methyltransferase